jgi:hypothetical protein
MNRPLASLALASLVALAAPALPASAADDAKASAAATAAQSAPAATPDAEGFVSLFDGKSLAGWKVGENAGSFKVIDGAIVVNGDVAHLFYVGPVANHDFKDFHFKAEVMTLPNSNSGIYFHTKYQEKSWPTNGFECQVNNTYKPDPKKTGGLYAVKDVMNTAPVKDDEWFLYEIVVKGQTVTIKINGKTTTEWTQPADFKAPSNMPGRKLGSGTFALQGHDPGSTVKYRNITVKPLGG